MPRKIKTPDVEASDQNHDPSLKERPFGTFSTFYDKSVFYVGVYTGEAGGISKFTII